MTVHIRIHLSQWKELPQNVNVKVYDVLGRVICDVLDTYQKRGGIHSSGMVIRTQENKFLLGCIL
jgi:hypothetical protein